MPLLTFRRAGHTWGDAVGHVARDKGNWAASLLCALRIRRLPGSASAPSKGCIKFDTAVSAIVPPGRHFAQGVEVHTPTALNHYALVHGGQYFAGFAHHKAAGNAPQIAHAVKAFSPLREVVPCADSAGLGVEAANTVEAKAGGKCGHVRQLRDVLHEIANTRSGLLNIGHAVGPHRPHDAPRRCAAALVPMGHFHAVREPNYQVVMHCPAFLQLCNPKVSGGDADASAPAPEALSSCADVV